MEKKTNDKPQVQPAKPVEPVKAAKPVKPKKAKKAMTNEEKRKRRMAWMCGILALLNIVALLLLFLLPFNCSGTHHKDGGTDSVIINDTTIIERNITHEEEQVSEEDTVENMDETVEREGGNTDAFMRFTIAWNQNNNDRADLDAHASEPTGAHIFFRAKGPTRCGGHLDVDMRSDPNMRVENIAWPSADDLADGDYEMGIHNFNNGNFGNCDVKLKVGNQVFMYKVGYFKNSHGAGNINPSDIKPIAVVTIKDHQVKDIRHIVQPTQE